MASAVIARGAKRSSGRRHAESPRRGAPRDDDRISRHAGFTLLELIVALAIAVLIFAVVVPIGFRRNSHATLLRSARDVAAALRLTRSRAVVDNRPTRFIVDVDHALYRGAGVAATEKLPPGMRVELITAAEETEGRSLGAIRFYPDGSSSGGNVELSLGADRIDVAVDWLTGGATLHDAAER